MRRQFCPPGEDYSRAMPLGCSPSGPMDCLDTRSLTFRVMPACEGKWWSVPGLLDRRPRVAHHLAPLVVVALEVGAELRGRVRVGLHAGRGDEFLHLIGAYELTDLPVELGDDVARRSYRFQHADPHDRLVTGDARLCDGRHLGHLGRAL